MPNFIVTNLSPINTGEKIYEEGDSIELSEKDATPLLDLGVIAPALDHGGKPKPPAKDAG